MFEGLSFLEGLIFLLLGLLFFKEQMGAWLSKRMGLDQEEKAPLWATQLTAYFNHDTTEHHEKTHAKLDSLQRTAEDSNRTLKEIKEYGIVCRDK